MSPSTVLLQLRRLVGPPQAVEETDGQLLERFLQVGDEMAFEVLLERHGVMVLGVCRRLLHDPHQIEDAFQATFLVLVRKAASITRRESVGSWLHGVARRVALRVRGRSARQLACEKARAEMIAFRNEAEPARDDVSAVLDEEVQRLPPKYRTAMVLCYLEGKTNEEAARQLGCPAGTIFTRLSRGREMLRGRLVRRGVVATSAALTATGFATETASAAIPSALRVATLHEAMQAALGKAAGSPAVAALVEATVRDISTVRWKALGAILLTLATVGGVTAALTVGGPPPESRAYPRRLLAINVRHSLFADPVEPGPAGRDFRAVAGALSRRLHIAERNTTLLDEAGRDAHPLTRPVLERVVTDFLAGSRALDRIILMFAGRSVVIKGKAYLVPFEGESHSPDRLISLDWLYKKLEACKARQKVLLVDLCRSDRSRVSHRPGTDHVDDILDRALRSPPEGVEIWSACTSGQSSLTDEAVGGSLFLEQLFLALEGPAGRQVPLGVPLPADPLPISKLAAGVAGSPGVNAGTEDEARRRFKLRQTPRLVGTEKETYQKFDPKEAPPPRVAIDWSSTRKPSLRVLHRAVAVLNRSQLATPNEFRGSLDDCKKKVVRLQQPLAVAGLELQEALEELELPANKPAADEPTEYQLAFDYTVARVKAAIARNHEYNSMLSDIRTEDMPVLPPQHGAWRLVANEKIRAKGMIGKEARDMLKGTAEIVEKLEKAPSPVPWKAMAERDNLLLVGLEWQTAP